jgi:hypothetical protein
VKKYILVLLCVIIGLVVGSIFGCSGGDAPDRETANKAAASIVYSKDPRTGLCFGSVTSQTYSGFSVISITNLPCAAVEKYINSPKESK